MAFGSGAAAVCLAVLMIFAPGASAARAHPFTTYTAPYGGIQYDSSSTGTSGCGLGTIVSPPVFNLTTGVGTGAVSSSDKNCAPNVNGNDGDGSEQIGLSSTNFTTTTGSHTVTAKWSLHWGFTIKTNRPTGTGTAEAIGTVSVSVEIWDSTNFTVVTQKSWYKQYIDFNNVTTTSGGGVTGKVISATTNLVAGHVYYIYVTIFLFAYSSVTSSPGGTASSKVDLASTKDKGTLLSYGFT